MPAHPSFYARRKVFEKHGIYSLDYKIAADYDMLVRLFLKHRIKAKYMPMDFVTMLMGGLSTRGVRSRVVHSNIKLFRAQLHGVIDAKFFLFRLTNIHA